MLDPTPVVRGFAYRAAVRDTWWLAIVVNLAVLGLLWVCA